jgi:uncharacterized protein (TIGR02246 family)
MAMLRLSSAILLILSAGAAMQASDSEPRRAVEAFYAMFNSHKFDSAAQFTTEDWVHINPEGGITRGREATVADLKEVHSTFLKGVTDRPETFDIRMATPDVAIVTVVSLVSPFTTPDGKRHENEQHIRTFVVVKHKNGWLISQDQNTTISH